MGTPKAEGQGVREEQSKQPFQFTRKKSDGVRGFLIEKTERDNNRNIAIVSRTCDRVHECTALHMFHCHVAVFLMKRIPYPRFAHNQMYASTHSMHIDQC